MNLNPLPWLFGCWLKSEMAHWTATGIIEAEQEQRIICQYPKTCCGANVSRSAKLTLFAMASCAIVLALLLIVCDSWRSIPFSLKLGLGMVLMVAAHGLGYWCRFHRGEVLRGDRLFLLGTLLYGCAVLVAVDRAYGNELYPWGFFFWSVGTLPLALVLNSLPMLVLANLQATVWFLWQMGIYGEAKFTSPFLGLALFLIYWSYANRSRGLIVLTLVTFSLWWAMLPVALDKGPQGFYWVASLGPLLYLVGLWHDESHPFAQAYRWLGVALVGVTLPMLSLPSVAGDLMAADNSLRYRLPWWLVLVVAGLQSVSVLPQTRERRARWLAAVLTALAITAVPALVGLAPKTGATVVLVIVFSAAIIAVSATVVVYGGASDRAWCVALGAAYSIVWAALVCLDGKWRLSSAALVLLGSGAALFLAARYWPRWQKANHDAIPQQTA